jgi:hypothetical protein
MRDRMAGELLIQKLVLEHGQRPPQSKLARFFGVPPVHQDDWKWFAGAVGERTVAQTLSALPAAWYVFHSLPIGTDESDIDHVVVGPPGIYSINTKHHAGKTIWVGSGTFMVNGQKQPYIRNSEHEAERLTRIVRSRFPWAPAVQPVIAVVNAKSITVKTTPRNVHIDSGQSVIRWLRKQRPAFSPDTVDQIAAFLDDPRTWRASEPINREQLTAQFNDLSHAFHRARTIQTAWKLVGIVLAIVASIWVITTVA